MKTVYEFSYPAWDMSLILNPEDYGIDTTVSPSYTAACLTREVFEVDPYVDDRLLEFVVREMEDEDVANLPEWGG